MPQCVSDDTLYVKSTGCTAQRAHLKKKKKLPGSKPEQFCLYHVQFVAELKTHITKKRLRFKKKKKGCWLHFAELNSASLSLPSVNFTRYW